MAAADDGVAVGDGRPSRVHGHAADRPLRGRSLRVHAQRGVRACRKGSTPIDLAYAVHTDVGSHCVSPRSTGVSCRCTIACARATSWRSSPASRAAAPRATGSASWSPAGAAEDQAVLPSEQREDTKRSGDLLLRRCAVTACRRGILQSRSSEDRQGVGTRSRKTFTPPSAQVTSPSRRWPKAMRRRPAAVPGRMLPVDTGAAMSRQRPQASSAWSTA